MWTHARRPGGMSKSSEVLPEDDLVVADGVVVANAGPFVVGGGEPEERSEPRACSASRSRRLRPGSVLHGAAEVGVPVRAIAEAIGRQLDLPTTSITPDDAGEHFGWLAGFVALDVPASSAQTRERLGREPTHPGPIDDLEQGHYTRQPVA